MISHINGSVSTAEHSRATLTFGGLSYYGRV
jgi:hypothetical protein